VQIAAPLCGACLQVCKEKALQTDAKAQEIPFQRLKGVWVLQNKGKAAEQGLLELLGKAQELGAASGAKAFAPCFWATGLKA